jgi:hypothetical protein
MVRKGERAFEDIVALTMKDNLTRMQRVQARLISAQRELFDVDSSDLASYTKFESVLGHVIMQPHQIVVQVLEAEGLRASTMYGESLDSYCQIYAKGKDFGRYR